VNVKLHLVYFSW